MPSKAEDWPSDRPSEIASVASDEKSSDDYAEDCRKLSAKTALKSLEQDVSATQARIAPTEETEESKRDRKSFVEKIKFYREKLTLIKAGLKKCAADVFDTQVVTKIERALNEPLADQ